MEPECSDHISAGAPLTYGMDESDLASYRPIFNLNTISKIVERLFLATISPNVISLLSSNLLQSAYLHFHSTETALLKIMNDISNREHWSNNSTRCVRHVGGLQHC